MFLHEVQSVVQSCESVMADPRKVKAVDIRPYGRLPVLAVWCFFGTCFYSFVAYQMYGERGLKNRKAIRVMMGLEYPEVTADDEEWETLINESTYSNTKDDKEKNKLWH
ncbi:hypothetical protein OS493_006317 [Desmophyllum pertusum]|uniref:Uncharacterized protein n=1 Tax=Desmophyllum pertusum TaxID=174260 RepID=A0A9X0A4M5_9CNID|nr:hypothetical protein OS493_006317 [Desmophyllum pertusum]